MASWAGGFFLSPTPRDYWREKSTNLLPPTTAIPFLHDSLPSHCRKGFLARALRKPAACDISVETAESVCHAELPCYE